jgi:hypothetical protein
MAFVNSELKRYEEDWDGSLGISADSNSRLFAVERNRSFLDSILASFGSKGRLLALSIFTRVRYFTSSLGFGTGSALNLISSQLLGASSSFVENFNLESDISRESILNH